MFKAGRVPVIPFDLFLWGALKLLQRFPLEGLLELPGEREEEGKEEEEEGGGGKKGNKKNKNKRGGDKQTKREGRGYVYPEEMADKIKKVIAGMAYITPRPHVMEDSHYLFKQDLVDQEEQQPPKRILRTLYTPYSDPKYRGHGGGVNQPMFLSGNVCEDAERNGVEDGGFDLRLVSRRVPWTAGDVSMLMPLVDGELDWLEGFLEVCTWMGSEEVVGGVGREIWRRGLTVGGWWRQYVLGEKGPE